MKVIRVYEIRQGLYEVVYTLKTEGNRHFYHSTQAPDEITAYVKGLREVYHRQVELLENKMADYETICQTMPNADFSKEIKRLRKLLTDVHKSGGGYEEQR